MARYSKKNSIEIHKKRTVEIVTSALKIFADNGIEKTTMSKIAEEIGISKGLMYHYFTSKDEILEASLNWAIEDSQHLIHEVNNLSGTSIEKIFFFTKSSLSPQKQAAFRMIQRALQFDKLDENTKKSVAKFESFYIESLLPIFIEGQTNDEIIEREPIKLVEFYLTVLSGLLMEEVHWATEDENWNIQLLIRMIEK
ncbi:TetR/AcrR family transcriptional regulator [Bacillus horti]|uniref:AcrR family transcriptional regulator n=1 Tax=Caldalkalibacillus horti TaxID=77523 RepID=A0ABT9VWI6_9BACI|nr:TetR/AcrR family transcriptional regulator [Bacillus horti]MDQ0165354.1 AcrR family transcriptional regulator [Bacillus horti]